VWIDISFATDRHFHPGLIFVFKAGVYPFGAQYEAKVEVSDVLAYS